MLKKLLICPFFGPLPAFYPQWRESVRTLERFGYHVLVTQDLEDFNARCGAVLGFPSPIVPGTGKLWDYRCAFGELFAKEIEGYDYWGHTDFDVVYGRVDRYVTEEMLNEKGPNGRLDIYSDEDTYIGGHFTLYRNISYVNSFFRECEGWAAFMQDPTPNGWVEFGFSVAAKKGLNVVLSKNQATRDNRGLELDENGYLRQNGREVMLAHFKDQKRWPL